MIDFDLRPILIFWEVTRACPLKCRHCRADAILEALPGELTTEQGLEFVDSLRGFGRPYPVLIFTGGDPLMRDDLYVLVKQVIKYGFRVGLAPSVSDKLTDGFVSNLRDAGIKYVSISLDGASSGTHDYIRGIEGHFRNTIEKLVLFKRFGFVTQVNTVVTRGNVHELPYLVKLLDKLGIRIWEVFFLIQVGRGTGVEDLSPDEYEDVMHFLFEVSRYGFEVRTVEAPFYRRVAMIRMGDDYDVENMDVNYIVDKYGVGHLYVELVNNLYRLMGEPRRRASPKIAETRDGKGVIFVAYNGDVYPSGFAPYKLGNILDTDIVDIYRGNDVLRLIREGRFGGRCGYCEYRDICGGSRARAYVSLGDILGEDPACIYTPHTK